MTIYLYNLTADPRTVDKSGTGVLVDAIIDGYSGVTGMAGTLRDRCDMVDPVFMLEIKSADIKNFNYLYVSEWARYYFVKHITVERNDLISVYCHEDVLYTYAGDIKALSAYVLRNELNYKPFLADPKRVLSQNEQYTVIVPTTGTGSFDPKSNLASRVSYVILLANNPGIGGTKTYSPNDDVNSVIPGIAHTGDAVCNLAFALNRTQIEAFFGEFFNTNWSGIINSLMGNASDGIADVISYPFQIPNTIFTTDTNPQAMHLFNHALTTQGNKLVANPYLEYSFGTFTYTSTDFVRREPYTKATLYLPYVGEVPIPMIALNDGITVKYLVAVTTGDAFVSVVNSVTGAYVYKATAHIGIHVPVSRTNNVEQARNNLLLSTGMLGAMASPVGGLVSLGNTLIKRGLNTQHMTAERTPAVDSRMARYDPYVLITATEDLTPANYGHYYGLPCEDVLTLSGLTGFTVVGEVFGHMGFAQEDEQAEVMSLLKSGVIF